MNRFDGKGLGQVVHKSNAGVDDNVRSSRGIRFTPGKVVHALTNVLPPPFDRSRESRSEFRGRVFERKRTSQLEVQAQLACAKGVARSVSSGGATLKSPGASGNSIYSSSARLLKLGESRS